MPYTVTKFQETPNPSAIKCILDKPTGPAIRSYFAADQAKSDPLAATLFSIPGVTNILINDNWITVSKSPAAPWPTIKSEIQRVLREAQ